jgi:hypothetical protein
MLVRTRDIVPSEILPDDPFLSRVETSWHSFWVFGLDPGQRRHPSALVAVEGLRPYPPGPPPKMRLRGIKRWELGTDYPQVVRETADTLLARNPTGDWRTPRAQLVVDAQGCGVPVVDMCRAAILPRLYRDSYTQGLVPAMTTSSYDFHKDDDSDYYFAGIHYLVQSMARIRGERRLEIASGVAEVDQLVQEFDSLHERVGAVTGKAHYEVVGLTGSHADILSALLLACAWADYWILRIRPPFQEAIPVKLTPGFGEPDRDDRPPVNANLPSLW